MTGTTMGLRDNPLQAPSCRFLLGDKDGVALYYDSDEDTWHVIQPDGIIASYYADAEGTHSAVLLYVRSRLTQR